MIRYPEMTRVLSKLLTWQPLIMVLPYHYYYLYVFIKTTNIYSSYNTKQDKYSYYLSNKNFQNGKNIITILLFFTDFYVTDE